MPIRMTITVLGAAVQGNNQVVLKPAFEYQQDENGLVLTCAQVAQITGVPANDIWGIVLLVDCEDAVLRIVGIPHVRVHARTDSSPQFGLLLVADTETTCTLVGLTIRQLEIDRTHWQLVDSSVDRINVGIRLARQLAQQPQAGPPPLMNSSVSDSRVGLLRVFAPQGNFCVLQSVVSHLLFERTAQPVALAANCDHLEIRNGAAVERLSVSARVAQVTLDNSTVEDLRVTQAARIEHLTVTGSTISRAYNCQLETFEHPDLDTWALVQQSARVNNDDALYATAGYEGMELWRRESGCGRRSLYWFLKVSCGYGYRPSYTLFAAFLVLSLCTLIFWIMTFIDENALSLPQCTEIPPSQYAASAGAVGLLSVPLGPVLFAAIA